MRSTDFRTWRWVFWTLLLTGTLAYASPRDVMRVKVLNNEQWMKTGAPDVETDCIWREISAYCTSSAPETYVEKAMKVQDTNGRSMLISCTVFNQWSHCTNLPIGETFPAWQKKRALVVRYTDSKGKQRNQEYQIDAVNHQ